LHIRIHDRPKLLATPWVQFAQNIVGQDKGRDAGPRAGVAQLGKTHGQDERPLLALRRKSESGPATDLETEIVPMRPSLGRPHLQIPRPAGFEYGEYSLPARAQGAHRALRGSLSATLPGWREAAPQGLD
jgi:hypothetical protein